MSARSHAWLSSAVIGLSLAAIGALAIDPWISAGAAERSARFQQGVGGLGFGPAIDLSECEFAFDPRIERTCLAPLHPIPGGTWPCRCHPGTAFGYPPLPPAGPSEKGRDAPLP